ncbi:MAG: hypothetical protein KC912_17670 [Proteobacteria bacterium]|nr:hypothetical protein [Pseudomonadota bacterium]
MEPLLTTSVVAWAVIRAALIGLPVALVVRAMRPVHLPDHLSPSPEDEVPRQPSVRNQLLSSPPWVCA